VRRKGSPESDPLDILQDQIQTLTVCAPEYPLAIRKHLKHVLGRINAIVPANAYFQPVEAGGSEGRYDALHTIMSISRPSKLAGHDVRLVIERVVDDDQTLWCMGSLAEDILYGGTRHVHEGFCDR